MVPWTWWSHEATRNFSSSSCTLSTVAIFVARLTYFKKKRKKKLYTEANKTSACPAAPQ
jgi:hypothetical protein